MVEDHLYWALLDVRWTNRANFDRGIAMMFDALPAPVRPLARPIMRRRTIARTRGHGMGRHSREEIEQLAIRDLDALAAMLGDHPFLMGEQPCSGDAAVFGMVASLLTPSLDSRVIEAAGNHSNLVSYRDRIIDRWFATAEAPSRATVA
jgi:glutathione S-transferase